MSAPRLSGKDNSLPNAFPFITTSPEVGVISPHIALINIVLPLPLIPISPYTCPSVKVQQMSSSTFFPFRILVT